ncbi:MAG: hypothetical protein CMC55_06900 [Flavobacteriaceae bacterium]|uniref:alpha/beta hydrolase n=1 Tax=Bizionia echini TaxID=649333 RepID=UPI000C8BCC76|nr:hypothetical protein [Flavobacteriaceae bacterium]
MQCSIVRSIKRISSTWRVVDIGGYNIHLLVEGKDKKGPTVVFFHGAGDIALHWNLVLPKVGKFATAVAIDHAGEGWSDHGHGLALNQQAYDTYQALKKGGYQAPYILVGHSLGGITANLFASKYKEEVIGVVMVDATHPDVVLKIFNKNTKKMERKRMRLTADQPIKEVITSQIKEPKETKSFQGRRDFGDKLDKFSEEDKARFNWIYNERPFTYVKGQSDTYEAEIMQDMYLNKEKYTLGNMPLIVISGGNKSIPEGDENWSSEQLVKHRDSLQKDLLNLSTNSKQIIAKKSGHYIQIDQPEIIVKQIRQLVENQ